MRGSEPVVLVADDETATRKYLGMNLRARGYDVLTAADGSEALQLFSQRPVNLVLLDIGMPGPTGVEVCQRIRQISDVPIIMLSARSREADKIVALDRGADDYLTKPFGVGELMARVGAALRRSGGASMPGRHSGFGDIHIDFPARRVWRKDREVQLTSTEFTILSLLMRNAGKVLNHRYILESVWGGAYSEEREYLRAYMYRLRHKLERDPKTPRHILTIPGVGYQFQPDPDRHSGDDGGERPLPMASGGQF